MIDSKCNNCNKVMCVCTVRKTANLEPDRLKFISGVNLIFENNEIYLLDSLKCQFRDWVEEFTGIKKRGLIYQRGRYFWHIIASTEHIPKARLLDRDIFVKPLCIEELSDLFINTCNTDNFSNNNDELGDAFGFFKAGYAANEKVFSHDQVLLAMRNAFAKGQSQKMSMCYALQGLWKDLYPISEPKTIECDVDFQNIVVEW